MPGIHRQRPGAAGMQAATDAPPVDLGDDVWMSPGWSNSYLLPTDDGRVVINTGMGFEGPLHRRAYDTVDDLVVTDDDLGELGAQLGDFVGCRFRLVAHVSQRLEFLIR